MPRPSSKITLVFQSADQRNYFVRTQVPADAEYTVTKQPSLLNPKVEWFYLKLNLKPETKPSSPSAAA